MSMMGVSLRANLQLRTELRQTLTPQQRQLVDVLELPDQTLEGYLEEQLTQNPALVRVGDMSIGGEVRKGFARRREDDLPPIEARMSASSDLMEHLFQQFRLERTTDAERMAGFQIIGNLDHRGLLAGTLEEVAESAGVTLQDVEGAQWVVMRLDPIGCGAVDMPHYLKFMVQEQWPDDPFFPELIDDHLDNLRRKRFKRIAKAMDMDPEDVEEYHSMLADEVDPWPARGFSDVEPDYVRPCMDVHRDEETGQWVVNMHEPAKAPVKLDSSFEEKIRDMPDGPEKKEGLEKLEQARWVVRSLEERHSLVKQIAEIAVRHQRAFFSRGPVHMQNLTMADVADRLGRDTSTVSRAVMGRYFQWEKGIMGLRALFVNRGGGQDTSEAALHTAINGIIEEEDKRRPLSDQAIANLLKTRGMSGVARRTVAKHRERIGIPSSRDRRKR